MKLNPIAAFAFALFATNLASAQAFVGFDDFASGLDKWNYTFSIGDGEVVKNLNISDGALHFTKEAGSAGYGRGWAAGGGRDTFDFSWVMDITANNSLAAEEGEFGTIGFEVASGGEYAAVMLSQSDGTSAVFNEMNGDSISSIAVPGDGSTAHLRLAWNASTESLRAGYSFNSGESYSYFAPFDLSSWDGVSTAGFYMEVFGNSNFAGAIESGTMSLDNFSVTAVPEPSTYAAIAGCAILGFAAYRRRRQQSA